MKTIKKLNADQNSQNDQANEEAPNNRDHGYDEGHIPRENNPEIFVSHNWRSTENDVGQNGPIIKILQANITSMSKRVLKYLISSCDHDVSFKDKILKYQFIRGLADITAQERILESAAQVEGGELTLVRVLKIAEAFEMGRTSQQLVNQGGQLSKLSDYKNKKNSSRQESRPKTKPDDKCGNCGKAGHSSKLNDRR